MLTIAMTVAATVHAQELAQAPSRHITKIMARADGRSQQTAFKVSAVKDEYDILAALKLKAVNQSLVDHGGRYFDVIVAADGAGTESTLWFDISKFYIAF